MDGHPRGARAPATLAIAFTVVLVGCVGGTGQSPTPTLETPANTATVAPSLPASAEPTILPTATAPLGRLGAAWRAVTTTPTQWGSMAVTAGGPGWVALAFDPGGPGAAWTSVDGFAWERGLTLVPPTGITSDGIVAMTSFGTDVYGVGDAVGGVGDDAGEVTEAIVWRSRAGGPWAAIGFGELFNLGPCPAGCASVRSIAAGDAGVVVSGYRVKPVGSRFELETDLWSTADGTAWVRVPAPVPAGSSDKPAAEITVAAGGPGFVAAGALCDERGGACRAVTWTSTDGRTWAGPADLPGGKGAGAQTIAIGPVGAVVLGMRCTEAGCEMLAWGSADGIAWEKADLAGPYVEASTGLAAAGDTFLLVSRDFWHDGGGCAAWTSTDGLHWASEVVRPGLDPARPISQLNGLVGRPGAVLAMGQVSGPDGGNGFWVSP